MSGIIKYTIKDIKNQIKEKEVRNYWFLVNTNKSMLISKGDSKKESKNIIKTKITNNPNKYEGKTIRRLSISFHKENKNLNSYGIILITLNNFIVQKSIIKTLYDKGKEGPIWFTKKWLNWNGWDKKYLTKIVTDIMKNKINLSRISPNIYHLYF